MDHFDFGCLQISFPLLLQMGLVATLTFSSPFPNTHAWQKFLPTGPIGVLPLSEDKSSLVWTLPTREAKELLAAKDPER